MVSAQRLALAGFMALLVPLACEPQPDVAPRERSEPELVVLGSCDALTDTLRARIVRDYDDRVLAQAYAQMQSGLFGGGPPPIYVDDEYGPPYGRQAPGGPSTLIVTDGAHIVVAGETGVFIIDYDGITWGEVRGVPLLVGDAPTLVWGALTQSDGRVVIFSHVDLALGEPSSDPVAFDEKPTSSTALTIIDVLDVATGELDLGARRVVSGRLLGATIQNDTLRTVIRFTPPLPYLSTYPQSDDIFAVGGLAGAVDATRAANRQLIDAIDDADLTPRWGSGLDPDQWTPAGPGDCAAVRGAADSTGYTLSLYTEWTRDNEASDYWAVVGEPAEALMADTHVLLAARAQGVSWHLGTDLPLMTNLHHIESDAPQWRSESQRSVGWPVAQAPLRLAADRALVVVTDGPRNETSYAYANASLLLLEQDGTQAPARHALGYPRSAPASTLVAGDHIVTALDTTPTLWVRAAPGPVLVPELTEAGRTWFAAPDDAGRWVVLVDTVSGATRVELRDANHSVIDTLTLQDAPEGGTFFEGGNAPLPPRDLTALAAPAFFRSQRMLAVPLMISDVDEDQFFRTENTLVVIAVEDDTLTWRGRIVHRAPGFEGVGSDVPIRALDITSSGQLVVRSDQRITLHDGVTTALLADRVLR